MAADADSAPEPPMVPETCVPSVVVAERCGSAAGEVVEGGHTALELRTTGPESTTATPTPRPVHEEWRSR